MPFIFKVWPIEIPENPDSAPPLLSVSELPERNVPLPVKVPASATGPVIVAGLLPSGKLQLLLTVLVPVVCVNVTKLKVALLQLSVADVVLLKLTVPPLALNVEPVFSVNVPPKEAVPEGAVKVEPELVVKVPPTAKVVYEPKL